MTEQVDTEKRDGIALITLKRPPNNALTAAVRRDLAFALEDAIEQPDVTAIVLGGAGRGFSSGYDLSEFDAEPTAPSLGDICALIEDSPKPVVCALHGMAMGAGFELALAAHARVAQRDTGFALPEVKLGMMPGGGATQRLPRILGAQKSLEMLLTGQTILAADPRLKRLMTQLTADSPTQQALAVARDLAARGQSPKSREITLGFSDPLGFQKSIGTVAAQLSNRNGVERDILSCVEAAQLLPFAQGLAFEHSLYKDRLASPEARSARHLVLAGHRAARPPARLKSPPGEVNHVALLGADGLVAETAIACLEAGFKVSVLASDGASAADLTDRIDRVRAKAQGDPAQRATRQERLSIVDQPGQIAAVDLVLDSGQGVGLSPDRLRPDAVWMAIRSRVDRARAGALAETGRALGIEFYRPVHIAQVAELSITRGADPQAVATVLTALARLRRSVIQTTLPAGTVGARLSNALFAAACQLTSEGANPYEVDEAAHDLGFATGPFVMMDRVGLARAQLRLTAYADQKGLDPVETTFLSALVTQDRIGAEVGKGVYAHTSGRVSRDPDIPGLLADLARGDRAAGFDGHVIGAVLHGAVVNEAVALIAEGAVRRASDLDLLMVRGFGFAASRGGPLFWADLNGLFGLYQKMQALAPISPLWRPHAKLDDMIRNGQGFFGRLAG
ncbi:enoyl-CoA hydratase/isomerase family protein [Roseovarius sp. 2305UL8-3]|uniref:enoyl-CoA hydratase/isomerase family protein n=1 Tax=Roseovarius conchicola TaxID=3121636 RepID=UPI003526E3B7